MTKQKYEREIDEILERLERQGQRPGPAPRPRRTRPAWSGWVYLRALLDSPVRALSLAWLALSIGLPLLGVLLRGLAPTLAGVLVLAGALLFLAPLGLRLVGALRQERRPLWRGRVVELPYHGNSMGPRWRYQLWVWRQRWERWRRRR